MLTLVTYITAVVYEACQTPSLGGVDDVIMIHTKQVAATNARCLVSSFPLVCYTLSHYLPHILYHHLISRDGLHCKETPVVNGGLCKLELLFPSLGKMTDEREGNVSEYGRRKRRGE